MAIKKDRFRSPINTPIRRRAGQSAAERRDLLIETCLERAMLPVLSIIPLIVAECLHRIDSRPIPFPFLFSLLACAIGFAYLHLRRTRREVRKWTLGEQGERYVGQILDREMPRFGYKVYHDIQIKKKGRMMNVDHLLVGENGVFLIEDKTWSKPERGQTVVKYDGNAVLKNGVPYRKPVIEAFALAKETNSYLHSITGRSYPVKPLLVFVGWYNQAENRHDSPLLLLSEKALASFLPRHKPKQVPTKDDLRLLAAKLDAAEGMG